MNTDTPCKNCAFAIYEGKTQTGCAANLIEVFRRQKVTILDAYDEEREFYVLKNRICLMHRSLKWLEREPDINKLLKIAREQLRLKYEVIVPISDGDTFDDVKKTVESIDSQTLKPQRIILTVKKTHELRPSQLHDLCKNAWKIQAITEDDADRTRMLDLCIVGLKKTTSYFVTVDPKYTIPSKEFMSKLDSMLFDEMLSILYVKGDHLDIVSKPFAVNNGRGDIEAKLDQLIEEEPECQTMKRTSREIQTF